MQARPSYLTGRVLTGLLGVLALLPMSARLGPARSASLAYSRSIPMCAGSAAHRATGRSFTPPACGDRVPRPRTSCPCGQFFGVAALSSSDVWAVGRAGAPLIEHWDGHTWHLVPSPRVGREGGELRAIAALSARDMWAVGSSGGSDGSSQPLVEHWDGTRWRVVPSPTPPDSNYDLLAVAAVAPNDVWAVGEGPIIEHWNGLRWRMVPSPGAAGNLMGVAAISPHDVWAVGDSPSIVHWDGVRWRVVPSPKGVPPFAPGAAVSLNAITAVSARDLWAVGSYDATDCCEKGSGPLTEHWDGVRWRVVASPNIPHSVEGNIAGITFSGVAAVTTRDIWAVGTGMEHWNGTRWRIIPSPIGPGGDFGPVSVAAISTRDVWAVGSQSNTESLVEHWDGRRWQVIPTPNTVV